LARISGPATRPSCSGGQAPQGQADHARGQHKRPVGASQRPAHGFDGAAVSGAGGGEVAAERDLVLEGQMDDAVRVGGHAGQALRVVEVASMDQRADFLQLARRGVRSGQADHLVAGSQEFGHEGGADPA
jgi:hypothetical protein